MNFEVRKTIEWNINGSLFALRCAGNDMELTTPSGQRVSLPVDEWRVAAQMILKARAPSTAGSDRKRMFADQQGKPWTEAADAELRQRWQAVGDIAALAAHFERTRGAIKARLVKLGLVEK